MDLILVNCLFQGPGFSLLSTEEEKREENRYFKHASANCYQLLQFFIFSIMLFRLLYLGSVPVSNNWTLGHDIYFVSDLLIEMWIL